MVVVVVCFVGVVGVVVVVVGFPAVLGVGVGLVLALPVLLAL